jgi:hypothetical protein
VTTFTISHKDILTYQPCLGPIVGEKLGVLLGIMDGLVVGDSEGVALGVTEGLADGRLRRDLEIWEEIDGARRRVGALVGLNRRS